MDKTTCKVPFGTMNIQPESKHLITTQLANGMVTNGKCVQEFENRFAQKFGCKYAIAVSSGTDADTLALAAMYDLGAQRGDEVIIPALTFVATANAVVNAGFKPVFVDVDEFTLNIDPNQIEQAITERTRAIMPVHLMGKPAEMEAIIDIANKHSLNVIEDTAEAHGAEYKGQKVGTLAQSGAFSLYAAHIISSIEGGMIVTNQETVDRAIRSLRNHGLQLNGTNWTFARIGFSSKMNELEAAVGLGNLQMFEYIIEKRRENFFYLKKRLDKFDDYMYTINEEAHEKLSPHAFPIILRTGDKADKDNFVQFLSEHGIDNRNLFYSIPTQTDCYKYLGHQLGDFPVAEALSDFGTHIGVHQDLTTEQLDYVANTIEKFLETYG